MEDQEKLRKRQREQEDPEENTAARSKAGAETPSLKEVEEFFMILQRIQVAVRYFDDKVNGDGEGKRFSGRLWDALETRRMELENTPTTTTTTTSEGDCGDLCAETVANELVTENNRVLDLNKEPDQDITEIEVNTGAN